MDPETKKSDTVGLPFESRRTKRVGVPMDFREISTYKAVQDVSFPRGDTRDKGHPHMCRRSKEGGSCLGRLSVPPDVVESLI